MSVPAPLICVMGVSAAGKSTVGALLAEQLGVPFIDGDALHPQANRAKMAAGRQLNDEDRWPWLDLVGAQFSQSEPTGLVLACSALRRVYRDRIRAAAPTVLFVHLTGPVALLSERAAGRKHEFMPVALLESQLLTLEPLETDETGFTVSVALAPEQIASELAAALRSG